ncbi:MAG: response regulator with CheY-like receiver AAA-type ATPase and DNA-binding domain [Bacteroidetes bacterium]|nr:MAG: response regulator with CheY-like receiver AAA-type ATPase and DNA-binding domain [Bacteroidota bacterium]
MKKKILAIDDEAVIRKLLETFLSKQYDVVTKANGMDAMSYIQNGNIPDLIICDILMPEMNGYDFVKQIRSSGLFSKIPLLMLSGEEDSKTRINFFRMRVRNFITKPFNPEELEVLVELILSDSN